MTKRTFACAAALLALPLQATAQNPVRDSMKQLFDATRGFVMATANTLSDEQYAFRPTDEVRTAGQILAHIADAQYLFCSSAAGESSPATESFEQTRTTKARIIQALEQGFAYCEQVWNRTTDQSGMGSASLFGQPSTVFAVLAMNSAHNYEHYGNLVTYMRINGIVPPSSM